MSQHSRIRGGTPVGYLQELPPVEAGAVLFLRLWCGGPDRQEAVRSDLCLNLGPDLGQRASQSLESICQLCAAHGRRPLMRHGPACKCLGSDEAWFANFIATAAEGEREDALMIAMSLIRADMAPALVSSAQEFGLAMKRMAIQPAMPHEAHIPAERPAYYH